MGSRKYAWRSLANSEQVDRVSVESYERSLSATGVQTEPRYTATWELHTTKEWVTSTFAIQVVGKGWSRSLRLIRDETGSWHNTTTLSGTQPSSFSAPGIAQGHDLSGALDVDLAKCPMTNTMPILRLDLLNAPVSRTPLDMAWIDVPSLTVIASDQYYRSIGKNSVGYESGTREVNVELAVDDAGIVTHYPDLATIIE